MSCYTSVEGARQIGNKKWQKIPKNKAEGGWLGTRQKPTPINIYKTLRSVRNTRVRKKERKEGERAV